MSNNKNKYDPEAFVTYEYILDLENRNENAHQNIIKAVNEVRKEIDLATSSFNDTFNKINAAQKSVTKDVVHMKTILGDVKETVKDIEEFKTEVNIIKNLKTELTHIMKEIKPNVESVKLAGDLVREEIESLKNIKKNAKIPIPEKMWKVFCVWGPSVIVPSVTGIGAILLWFYMTGKTYINDISENIKKELTVHIDTTRVRTNSRIRCNEDQIKLFDTKLKVMFGKKDGG